MWLDATYLKVRDGGRIVSVAAIIAVAADTEGRREIVGLHLGPSEAETFWTTFLKGLLRRGLKGVKLDKTVCHARREYARDEDGDGFCEVHVNTMEGVWSLLRSWLRPHRGVSQEKLPLYLGFFEFVHNARCRGRALLGELVAALVA